MLKCILGDNALLSDKVEEDCLDTINPPLQVNQILGNRVTRTKAMFYKNMYFI